MDFLLKIINGFFLRIMCQKICWKVTKEWKLENHIKINE